MAKVQKVGLFNPGLDITEEYEVNHAERILRMPNNGDWQLPENSEFKFDFNNGIGYRKDKKGDIGASEAGDDSKGGTTSK